jgi:hypothetical protein
MDLPFVEKRKALFILLVLRECVILYIVYIILYIIYIVIHTYTYTYMYHAGGFYVNGRANLRG